MDIQRLVSNGKISKLKNNLDKEIFKDKANIKLFLAYFSMFEEDGIFGLLSKFHIFSRSTPTLFGQYPEKMSPKI